MKMIMVAAVSRDGYLTKGDDPDPSSWTSDEDKAFFAEIKSKHQLFVMGSRTYDSGNVHPHPGTLRVILTKQPDKYLSHVVSGQLEFLDISPHEFIERYKNQFDACLVLGGGYVYSSFLEAGLIDEIYLTVEPETHGSGVKLLEKAMKIENVMNIRKISEHALNDTGTRLLHYMIE